MTDSPNQDRRKDVERLNAVVIKLRHRLEQTQRALEASGTGEVDSLDVDEPQGSRLLSLDGADHSYRVLVEAVNEGAATLDENWTILYCNSRFADMLETPRERVMGSPIRRFLADGAEKTFASLVDEAQAGDSRGETLLITPSGKPMPAFLSLSLIHDGGSPRLCLIAADLSAQKRNEEVVVAERLARSVIE
jgi:PAS domain S-box-containing protein